MLEKGHGWSPATVSQLSVCSGELAWSVGATDCLHKQQAQWLGNKAWGIFTLAGREGAPPSASAEQDSDQALGGHLLECDLNSSWAKEQEHPDGAHARVASTSP